MASEKRLIDAGDLWSDIMMIPHNGDMISSEEVEQAIMEAPTVDAVEVVRCKDCRYCTLEGEDFWCDGPIEIYGTVGPNDFCSKGERKDNG